MKTVGDKLKPFLVTGINPGSDQFFDITETSFPGKWKVLVYYPKDFTFVCPTEIVAYDKLFDDFQDRDAVLLTGSTDNEFCKLAWQRSHEDLAKIRHIQFADTQRRSNEWMDDDFGIGYKNLSLIEQLGDAVIQWFVNMESQRAVITDQVIQEKVRDIARELKIDKFCASSG